MFKNVDEFLLCGTYISIWALLLGRLYVYVELNPLGLKNDLIQSMCIGTHTHSAVEIDMCV